MVVHLWFRRTNIILLYLGKCFWHIAEERCPKGFLREANSSSKYCYKFIAAKMNWDSASTTCRRAAIGANLVSVRSAAESEFIGNFLQMTLTTFLSKSVLICQSVAGLVFHILFCSSAGCQGNKFTFLFICTRTHFTASFCNHHNNHRHYMALLEI